MPEDSRQSVQINQLEAALAGKYKIIGRIGAGGFGEVYLGEHTQLNRKVAIKILIQSISSQEDLVKRFQREARSAAALTHPNIIDIYDVGEGDGIYYFVMKYIEGETLSQRMQRDRKMDPAEAIHIIQQVADALDYAHENNVVHRDIKPANVMLDPYGKPLLMDFGVARVQYEGNLTKTGTLLGTPHYLAPEQPLGKPIDGRSDIYSLGIMFYEMLAGRPPFHDENSITLIFKHINEPPQPLNAQVPELDPELCFIVHKMIEKSVENRYQSAGEVVEALQKLKDIYPAPAASARRTSPTGALNTEKLLILAQDHIEQNKLSKAMEILGTISKRDPKNETAKRQIQEILPKLSEQVKAHIESKDFRQARQLISQMTQLSPKDSMILRLREEVQQKEVQSQDQSETIFKEHFVAAQEALEQNRTSQAIQHLTRASTINSSSQEIQELLKETQGKITSEIRLLEEKLDFAGAQRMLEMGREAFPAMVQTKAPEIVRHRDLYELLQQGREEFKQEKWAEAEKSLTEFLKEKPSSELKVFESLRKEAEDLLEKTREKLNIAHKPTPATIAKEPAAAAVAAPTTAGKTSIPRVAIYVVIGAIVAAAAWFISDFLNKQADIPVAQPVIRTMNTPKPGEPKPTSGEISITSEPEGATVLVGTEEKGVTPVKVADLPFGKHTITLKLKGFQDMVQEVELTQDQFSVEFPAVLQAVVPVVGVLMIESNPPGADVAIGTRVRGQTPYKLEKMNVGRYNITLRKEGYVDYTETVRVKENETTTVKAQLAEIPKPVVVVEKPKEPELKPGTLVQLGPGVTPPKSKQKGAVEYPDAARRQRLEGTVQLNMLISETGQVIDVRVLKSAHPVLDEAAMRTVKQWTYEPARKQNIPVRVWLSTSITFVKR